MSLLGTKKLDTIEINTISCFGNIQLNGNLNSTGTGNVNMNMNNITGINRLQVANIYGNSPVTIESDLKIQGNFSATGTITLDDTAVTPGSYTSADITVDQQGRITAASSSTSVIGTSVLYAYRSTDQPIGPNTVQLNIVPQATGWTQAGGGVFVCQIAGFYHVYWSVATLAAASYEFRFAGIVRQSGTTTAGVTVSLSGIFELGVGSSIEIFMPSPSQTTLGASGLDRKCSISAFRIA